MHRQGNYMSWLEFQEKLTLSRHYLSVTLPASMLLLARFFIMLFVFRLFPPHICLQKKGERENQYLDE